MLPTELRHQRFMGINRLNKLNNKLTVDDVMMEGRRIKSTRITESGKKQAK